VVAVVEEDLVVAQVAPEADRLRREARDPGDLCPGLVWLGGAVDAEDAPLRIPNGEAGDMYPPLSPVPARRYDPG
jgi:hypothetical protein